MSDLSFSKGNFLKLRAKNTIHLGRLERNIYEGDIVEFDGFTLKFNGQNVDMPELKAGIKRGWLTPAPAEAVSEIKVEAAPAPKKPEVIYDEERSVTQINKTEEAPANKFPIVVESQDDDVKEVSFVEDKSGATVNSASSASDGIAEAQGAKTIQPKLKTASKQKTILSEISQVEKEISALEDMEAPISRSDFKVTRVDDDLDTTTEDTATSLAEDTFQEDIETLQAVETEAPPATGAIATGTDNSKVVTLPGGVEWDMNVHWAKRAKKAVELFSNDPDTLDLIYQIETKGVVASIQKSLAELG